MLKDIKALDNYISANFENGVTITSEHLAFLTGKVISIREQFTELERKVEVAQLNLRQKTAEMQERVSRAEEREKAQVERQKQFGLSQTSVESERHKNIMEEIKALKDGKINQFNRSSYPFFPRHQKRFTKKKVDDSKKKNEGDKK